MEKRSVGFWLGSAILFMPYIFAWFTLKRGFSWLSRIVSLGWLGLWIVLGYNDYVDTQNKIKIDQQQITELESKANDGNIDALIQLAKKMDDGYFSNEKSGKIKNSEKTIIYLDKASQLGSVEAKQMLIDLKNKKKEEELNKIQSENKTNVIEFFKGDWIFRNQEKYTFKISFDNFGNAFFSVASEEEMNPERYKSSIEYRDDLRYDKYKNILFQDGKISDTISDTVKEIASDKASDTAKYVVKETIDGAYNMYGAFLKSDCTDSIGYMSDLENDPRYSKLKIKYPNSLFFRTICPRVTNVFISDFSYNEDKLLTFQCDNETCIDCDSSHNGCGISGHFTRINQSDIRTAPKKTPLPIEKEPEIQPPLEISKEKAMRVQAEQLQEKIKTSIQPENTQPSEKSQNTPLESASSLIDIMIKYATDFDKRAAALKSIESLPKPQHGNKKEARKLNDQSLELAKQSNYKEALPLMVTASELDPADVEIINNLAYLQIKLSDFVNAKKSLIQTLTLKPTRSGAWADLAMLFIAENNDEFAKNCYINYYSYAKNAKTALEYLATEDPTNTKVTHAKKMAFDEVNTWDEGD